MGFPGSVPGRRKYGGIVGSLGLADWWAGLSEEERRFLRSCSAKGLSAGGSANARTLDCVDIKAVSNQLRHKRISTTEGYVGPIPDAQRAGADKMDDVLKLKNRTGDVGSPKDPQIEVQ